MTNEELAARIQAGEIGRSGELWAQVERFIFQQAAKLYYARHECCDAAGATLDDLIQAGFLALMDAVKAFDPGRGYKLLAWIKYPLKNRWRELLGLRGQRRDPLNHAGSLDRPLSDDDPDSTVIDTIPSQEAQERLEEAEDTVWREQVRGTLDHCMTRIDPRQAEVIRGRYYQGDTLSVIGSRMGASIGWVQQLERKGMRRLRGFQELQGLRDNVISRHGYNSGLSAFRSRQASSVELTVEQLDELSERGG